VVVAGADSGACSAERLRELIAQQQLTKTTLVWRAGLDNWVAAQDLPEVAALFVRVSPPPVPAA
jgi:hypothetical protein